MPLTYQVLGRPGTDNALFVKVDTGQSQTRLLFDCGDGCPHQVSPELREVDHLCFSHLHMDHVSGFDLFFRVNFDRTAKENHIRSEEHTSELQSLAYLVCRLLLEKKNYMAPPEVICVDGSFYAGDEDNLWLLMADRFGAVFHRSASFFF